MSENFLKITFLGTATSQGIPVIGSNHPVCLSKNSKDKRLRSSIQLSYKDTIINIDCGTDFRQQMLKWGGKTLDAVLLTHEHTDHVGGLDDVRPYIFNQKKNMNLYGEQRVLEDLKIRYAYAFSKVPYPGAPRFDLHEIKAGEKLKIKDLEIETIRVMHGKLPILGYKFHNITYLTDVKTLPEESYAQLKNLDILIISCLRKERPHPSHVILEECLAIIERIKPQRTYLTHVSHLLGFHEEVEKQLPKGIYLAYDGLVIEK